MKISSAIDLKVVCSSRLMVLGMPAQIDNSVETNMCQARSVRVPDHHESFTKAQHASQRCAKME